MINTHKANKDLLAKNGILLPLAQYLIPLIGDKKEVKIADIGSGPISLIGRYYNDVKLAIYASDKQDFTDFWTKHGKEPVYPIARQDMEKLTYPDEYFDIVHSANALDHTKDALSAVMEMARVCKKGGWVYITCNLDQLDTGGKHYWNADEEGVFENGKQSFDLKGFGFDIKYIDLGGQRRYDSIVATLKKQIL